MSALALSFGASALPVTSFAQDAAPQQGAPGAPPLGWFKTCTKQDDSDLCVVQNVTLAQNGQLITAVGLITVEGKVNRKILQVSVPTARLVPPGVIMQIDNGKGQKLDYAVCLPDKCTAEVPLTDPMIAALKKGTDVIFTSINFRRAPNPIKISLNGFTGAFDGPAISQSQLAESSVRWKKACRRRLKKPARSSKTHSPLQSRASKSQR